MILGSCFLKYAFETVTVNLWKSKSPGSIVQGDWKFRGWFVRARSIHRGQYIMFFKTSRILYE